MWQVLQRGDRPMGVNHGRLGVGRMYQRFGRCCKSGTGQWVSNMADWVSAGCRNGASAAKVGQADGSFPLQNWEFDQGILILDCASMSMCPELGDVFLNCSLLSQGSKLGDGSASSVHRHERLLEFLFKNFPCPKGERILGKGLFIVVCSPGLSHSLLHVREAKGNPLLIVVINIVVDKQVSFDRHQPSSGCLLVPIILYWNSNLQFCWFGSGGGGGRWCPKRGEGVYRVLSSRRGCRGGHDKRWVRGT